MLTVLLEPAVTMGIALVSMVMMRRRAKPSRIHLVMMLRLVGLLILSAILVLVAIESEDVNKWGMLSLAIIALEFLFIDFL